MNKENFETKLDVKFMEIKKVEPRFMSYIDDGILGLAPYMEY